tara:strand:+ start:533 stop:1036 length:504 start_codon:yes stop_codon:yes gene_type:complete
MIGQGNTQPATEQENKQAQIILQNIEQYLFDDDAYENIVQKIREGGEDPATMIGAIVGQLLHAQMVSARGAGKELSRDILIPIAAEVVNAIIEIAMDEGLINIQDESQLEQIQGDAMIAAVDAYMSLGDDGVNKEAAGQFTQNVMQGRMNSPQAQQGMINNMVGGAA